MGVAPVHVGMHEDVASMSRLHEANPLGVDPGVGWYAAPSIAQGMRPDNSLIPWWPGPTFDAWRAVVAWWICYQAASGHTASNTSVEVAGTRLAVLRKTGQWEVLSQAPAPVWFQSMGPDAVSAGDPSPWSQTGLGGGVEVQPGGIYIGDTQAIHGGAERALLWSTDSPDFDAVHVLVKCRLALKNRSGVDDRSIAKFIIQAGADYYPSMQSTKDELLPATYYPGIGVGRFVIVRPEWRTAAFTVANAGIDMQSLPPPPVA